MSFYKVSQNLINDSYLDSQDYSSENLLEKEKNKLNISFQQEEAEKETCPDAESNESSSSDGIVVIPEKDKPKSPAESGKEIKEIKKGTKEEKKPIEKNENEKEMKDYISNENSIKQIKANLKKEKIIKYLLQGIEILLGLFLSFLSGFLFYLSLEFSSSGQKFLSLTVEVIIFFISLYGINPKKSNVDKKILFSLYLWIDFLLIPISFFSESGIKDAKVYIKFNDVLLLRLILVVIQELLFCISLVAKINI